MPSTGKVSPASYGKHDDQWQFPVKAFVSDNNRAKETTPGEIEDYYDFDLSSIPSNAIIDEVRMYAEGYVTTPEEQFVNMGWKKDGTRPTSWTHQCNFTGSEALKLVLTVPNLEDPKSAWVDVLLSFLYTETGGCISPDSLVEMWDRSVLKATEVRKDLELLSYDFEKHCFCKAVIKKIIVHRGNFLLYKFFTRKPDGKTISDVCVSGTHPLFANNLSKAVEAKDLKIGDTLTDLWELEGFGTVLRPVPIVRIERVPSKTKIEIVCEPKIFFAGDTLGRGKT